MARLTKQQWADARADCEVRCMDNCTIAKRYNVSEAAVRKAAIREGWVFGKSSSIVEKSINVIKEMVDVSSQSSRLSTSAQAAIFDEVQFRLESDKDLQAIQSKAMLMLDAIDSPAAAAQLMALTVKHREARLGKTPLMAMQINVEDAPRGAFVFRTQLATDTIEQDDDE